MLLKMFYKPQFSKITFSPGTPGRPEGAGVAKMLFLKIIRNPFCCRALPFIHFLKDFQIFEGIFLRCNELISIALFPLKLHECFKFVF